MMLTNKVPLNSTQIEGLPRIPLGKFKRCNKKVYHQLLMIDNSEPGNQEMDHPAVSKTAQRQLDASYCILNNQDSQKLTPILVVYQADTIVSAHLTADVQLH
jgi:hypothetical protein